MEKNYNNNPLIKAYSQSNDNIFLTGAGGTGKSYILKEFREWLKEEGREGKVLFTAPTGVASLNINGVTLHSALGIGIAKTISEVNMSKHKLKTLRRTFNNVDTIVIDEISFVNEGLFNLMNEVLKNILYSIRLFGNKRLIVVGDFLQLPPVSSHEEEQKFIFNSQLWKLLNFKTIYLTEIKRQENKMFSDILSKIRLGDIDNGVKSFLSSLALKKIPNEDLLCLVGTNALANHINEKALAKIDHDILSFDPEISILDKKLQNDSEYISRMENYFNNNVNVDSPLLLKISSRVIITKNIYDNETVLFNGDFGTIVDFEDDYITIYIDRLKENVKLKPSLWEKRSIKNSITENKVEYDIEAIYKQYPLKLAYAITVHKSQGMTFSKGIIFPKSYFDINHFYVAISRFSDHKDLYIQDLPNTTIVTSKDAIEFYSNLKNDIVV